MSHVIDSRVVEMQFDNSKFAKNCESTMKQLDDLDKTLSKTATGADFSAAEKALINLGKQGTDSASQVADSLSHLESRFSAWGTFAEQCIKRVADGFMDLATSVGKNLIEASTLGAMKDGLAEYNLLMESMQSMSVLTHRSTDDINEMFDKLNHYADLTKYSFADMVRNLSMFAASGASLDEMEVSMEGIANWMAAVGAPASDMQRIIYNIGQAFSKGYLQLIDWKSIENSKGMNGQQFVERFVENAHTLGTISGEEYADAMKAKAENNLSGWFREAISGKDGTKGFNKDVMLMTFKDFAENPDYIKAATQLKTFSEFLDNVKEEMGSGWQQTWRAVIGDLDNATRLFKGLKDSLVEYWDLGGEARNELIDDFNKLGGADQTFSILTNMVKIIGELKQAFMSGWAPNFPEITGLSMWEKSLDIATKLRHFLDSMKEGNWLTDTMEKLGDTTGNAVAQVGKLFTALGNIVNYHSEGLGALAGKIFDIAVALNDRLFNSLGKIGEKLEQLNGGLLGEIIDDIGAIAYALADLAEWAINQGFLGKAFNAIWKSIEDGVEAIGIVTGEFDSFGVIVDQIRQKIADFFIDLAGRTEKGTFIHAFAETMIGLDAKIVELQEAVGGLKDKWNEAWESVHAGEWRALSDFFKNDLLPALEEIFDIEFGDLVGAFKDIAFWRPDWSQFVTDLKNIWGEFELGEDILTNIKNLFEKLTETVISFWHRITSTGITGKAFTSIKEALGLDDSKPFDFSIFEDIFSKFRKGSDDVETASDKIVTSVKNIKEAFAGPGTQSIKMETLTLDGDPKEMEKQASLWETIKNKFQTYWEYAKTIDFNEDGIANWLKLFFAGGLVKGFVTLAKAFKTFADDGSTLISKISPLPDSLNKILSGLAKSLTEYANKLGSEAFATKWKTIAGVFLTIVGSIAVFGLLEKLDVDVMGNALVVMAMFGVLIKVMETANNFANQWQTFDSIALAAACIGFGSIIKNLTVAIVALTLCAKAWGEMNPNQIIEIFGTFGMIIATAYLTLMSAGKMMAGMWTDIEWAVMYVVLAAVGKLFKTMAVTLAGLTVIEHFGGDSARAAIMDLLAIWGMIELLVVTVMGFSAKIVASGTALLQVGAVLLVVRGMFTSLGLMLAELSIINGVSSNSWKSLGQLALVFAMIEAVLWSIVGCAAICQNTGIVPGLTILTTTIDQVGDMLLILGAVVAAFALLGPDKVKAALIELAEVLAELIVTMTAFSLINRFINGGLTLQVSGLVAVIGAMALVVLALAAFQAAVSGSSPESIKAAVDAFGTMMLELGGMFGVVVAVGAICALIPGVGEVILAAIGVVGTVFLEVGAAAALGGVAAWALSEAFDTLAEALYKFAQIDTSQVIANGTELLNFLAIELPEAMLVAAEKMIAGIILLGPRVGEAIVVLGANILQQLGVNMPKFIEAADKILAAAFMQWSMDFMKYAQMMEVALIIDMNEFADMLMMSDGIIKAAHRIGDALLNSIVSSIVGQDVADMLVPVADTCVAGLKEKFIEKTEELNEEGYFIMEQVKTGIEQGAEDSKYSIFNKGKEASDSFGQGMISNEDILKSFGLTMGQQAGDSLASEEVQSVYSRAGMTDANAFGSSFSSPEMQELMKLYGINTGNMLGDQSVLDAFTGAGTMDMSSYYQSLIDENPDLMAQLEAAGVDVGSLLSDEAVKNSFGDSGVADIEEFNAQQLYQLRTQRSDMVSKAAEEVKTYYESQQMTSTMNTAGTNVAKKAAEGMGSQQAKAAMETAGKNLTAGAKNGMENEAYRSGGILSSAFGIAGKIAESFRRAWNEHSPSKVADEIGAFFSMGLDQGLEREGLVAVGTANTIAEDISTAFTDNLAGPDVDDGLITITPEVDLTNVENAARKTSSLFNKNKAMSMSAQYAFAGTDGMDLGNTYNINVNEVDANNGFKVGRDIEKYLIRRY